MTAILSKTEVVLGHEQVVGPRAVLEVSPQPLDGDRVAVVTLARAVEAELGADRREQFARAHARVGHVGRDALALQLLQLTVRQRSLQEMYISMRRSEAGVIWKKYFVGTEVQ